MKQILDQKKKISNTTSYKGITKYYFLSIAKNIIKLADLQVSNKTILDYGCGEKIFKKLLPDKKIINYDIKPQYTEVKNFEDYKFDIVIFNHVLMYLTPKEINELIKRLKRINPNLEIILSLSRQNFLSKIFAFLTLNFDAHHNTLSSYHEQYEILSKNYKLFKKKLLIFGITDIYYFK